MNLAVDIGNIHSILINQDKPAHAGTGQRFHCHSAYAADTQYSNCAILQNIQTFRSDGQFCTRELMQHVGHASFMKPAGAE
ncbi:hypothetical protein D3C73_1042480 [compost metagenome]